ncbi:MAG: hydrogenase expression/formation protein [Rubrivivax sp.]|nr:hydrogenase expression/formation protein [Rubrivivax sp.]
MQRPVPIPVRAVGPGSQPEDDAALEVLPLPRWMDTFEMPHVPERVPASLMFESVAALQALLDAMQPLSAASDVVAPAAAQALAAPDAPDAPGAHPRVVLDTLSPAALALTNEVLGEGEVSIRLAAPAGGRAVHAQESVFAGVWRCGELDGDGRLTRYWLEAGALPDVVLEAAAQGTDDVADPLPWPAGTMNAPALLAELRARIATLRAGGRGGQINLSLLPLSPADRQVLGEALPVGPVAVISRGFGNCHIGSTTVPGVWRQQYFNSMNTLILELIEVAGVPEVAVASAEDLDDSRERLADLLRWMRESALEDQPAD